MTKTMVIIMSLLLAVNMISCNNKNRGNSEDLEVVDILNAKITNYFMAEGDHAQHANVLMNFNSGLDHQYLGLTWDEDGSREYTVYVSENENYSDAYVVKTREPECNKGITVPGKKYFWKVENDKGQTIKEGRFRVKEDTIRYIDVENVMNFRDLGGWKTEDGKTVKYGLLYRGGTLNGGKPITEYGVHVMADLLGIESEIDLRTQNQDDGNQTICAFGENKNYIKATITQCCYIFPEFRQEKPYPRAYDSRTKSSMQLIFDYLSDESKYPIYFHCNGGADRTGTLAFIINGLLGVRYEDLVKDFEMTSFSDVGIRLRGTFDEVADEYVNGVMEDDYGNYVAFGKMYEMMMALYSVENGSLSEAIKNYLVKACGISEEKIISVKNILLKP